MKNVLAIVVALVLGLIATTVSAQCANGVCQVPTRAPVLPQVQRAMHSVLEAQPVRSTAVAVVRSGYPFPQHVVNNYRQQQQFAPQYRVIWSRPVIVTNRYLSGNR